MLLPRKVCQPTLKHPARLTCFGLGGKIYIGTSVGNLHVYNVNTAAGVSQYLFYCKGVAYHNKDGKPIEAELDVKKNLGRKPIEQLGYVQDITSLAVLSGVYR